MSELAERDLVNLLIYFFLIYYLTNFGIFPETIHCSSMMNKAHYFQIIISKQT